MSCPARLASATLFLACTAANAGTLIHRCGNEYTDRPCAQARTFAVADTVSAAQRADAIRTAAREKALAAELTRDRLAYEAALRPAAATSLGGARPAPAAPSAGKSGKSSKKKQAAPANVPDFIAAVPKPRKPGS